MKISNFSNLKLKIICKNDENAIFFFFCIITLKKNVYKKIRVKNAEINDLNDDYILNEKEKKKKKSKKMKKEEMNCLLFSSLKFSRRLRKVNS